MSVADLSKRIAVPPTGSVQAPSGNFPGTGIQRISMGQNIHMNTGAPTNMGLTNKFTIAPGTSSTIISPGAGQINPSALNTININSMGGNVVQPVMNIISTGQPGPISTPNPVCIIFFINIF